jgi:hypothetical protein
MPTFTPKTVTLPPLTVNPSAATGNVQYLYGATNPVEAPLSGYLGNAASSDTGTPFPPTVGDLVGIVGGVASGAGNANAGQLFRAEDTVWNSTLLQTQKDFVSQFLGVAGQTIRGVGVNGATVGDRLPFGNSIPQGAPAGGGGTGAPNPGNSGASLRVATSGVYQFPCASATFKVGDLVGPAKAAGNALLSQKVVAVTVSSAAVGVVVEAGTSITSVKVRLMSVLNGERAVSVPAQA